jgi:CRISPR-associated protein Cas1
MRPTERVKDLHLLPRVRDGWSYLYVERCRVDQDSHGIVVHDERGHVQVPCALLAVLMLGPGATITHAAMRTLADCGCSVLWVGEEGVRFYAGGTGETRSARNLLRQARHHASPRLRMAVVRQMYTMRFDEALPDGTTLQQLRGMEGLRVRRAYAEASVEWGVEWTGRSYKRDAWDAATPINRSLSVAASCLYGLSHAAIVSAGYSPGLGFIHTGKTLSFVYDIADLYRTEVVIPAAFAAVAEGTVNLDAGVRQMCREAFKASNLLGRIVEDIHSLFAGQVAEDQFAEDEGLPGGLWDGNEPAVAGGRNHDAVDS